MRRIYRIQLNLDEMMASSAMAVDDAERGRWLRGFVLGANGHPLDANQGDRALAAGHALGLASHAEALGFQAASRVGGQRSAAARKAKGHPPFPPTPLATPLATPLPTPVPTNRTSEQSNKPRIKATAAAAAIFEGQENQDPDHEQDLFPGDSGQDHPDPLPRPIHGVDPRSTGSTAQRITLLAGSLPVTAARDLTLADLRVLFPALLVWDTDRDAARIALALYGAPAWQSALAALTAQAKKREPGKRRVMFADVALWLNANVELAVEDYHRAGINAPTDTPTQQQLDQEATHATSP